MKSSSGVQAETVLYLSDTREQEDWMSVTLIPTYSGGQSKSVCVTAVLSVYLLLCCLHVAAALFYTVTNVYKYFGY